MSLPVLLDGVILLVLGDHDLVQVDVVVQVVVKLKTLEWLEHFVDFFFELLDELFIFDP